MTNRVGGGPRHEEPAPDQLAEKDKPAAEVSGQAARPTKRHPTPKKPKSTVPAAVAERSAEKMAKMAATIEEHDLDAFFSALETTRCPTASRASSSLCPHDTA